MIYLDNAATSFFKPDGEKKAILDYLSNPGSPERGVNFQSINTGLSVFETREKIAKFFNFKHSEKVIFTSGITESLNLCINSLFDKNSHVIISYMEHNSVLRPLYNKNCDLSFSDGTLRDIKKHIKLNTKAVIITHASNVTGEIQDIAQIGEWAKEKDLLFIVDSAQSAGVIDVDVSSANIDFLCFSAHKGLLGLQGLGGIIINNDKHVLKPLKTGGTGIESFLKGQPKVYPNYLEAGTQNIPAIIGLSQSIDYINRVTIKSINEHEKQLRDIFLSFLEKQNAVEIYQNRDKETTGVVSFNIKGVDSARVSDYLDRHGIITRSGALCAPLVMNHYNIPSCVRVSFGINNTQNDVETLISCLDNFVNKS